MSQRKEKQYRLSEDKMGQTLLLKVGRKGELLTFDEKAGYNRAIRHCPNERSIFVDEQSEHAIVVPLVFEGGYLTVGDKQVQTQNFLDTHPDNKANGGNWFEEVDDEKEAFEDIRKEDIILDVKQAIRNKEKEEDGVYALEALVSVLKGSTAGVNKMSKTELKRELYNFVDDNPERFVDHNGNVTIFEDESVNRKYIVLRAISDGIISIAPNNRSINWAKTKETIVHVPMGIKPVDHLTSFLATDDGILVLEEIMKRS